MVSCAQRTLPGVFAIAWSIPPTLRNSHLNRTIAINGSHSQGLILCAVSLDFALSSGYALIP